MVECWPISVNILRGGIKKIAVNVDPRPYQLSTLTGDRTKDRVEELAKDLGYIFPVDPNRMKTELPFQNPAIISVLKQGVLTPQFKTNLAHIFVSTNKQHPYDVELPDAMVALLVATAVCASLGLCFACANPSTSPVVNMKICTATANHIKTFADGRAAAPLALHKVLHGLYKEISDFKSVQASAGSYSHGRSFLRVFSRLIAAVMTPPVPDVMTAVLRVLFYFHIDAHRVTAVYHNIKQVLSSAPTRIASSSVIFPSIRTLRAYDVHSICLEWQIGARGVDAVSHSLQYSSGKALLRPLGSSEPT
ncbi:hypothetical protein C8J57DRAFT_1483261 [Mycena rebaudengoi]|nr:hypothetical protein C8J57DRAFT_1483261 [Mycena rebaudengoi]